MLELKQREALFEMIGALCDKQLDDADHERLITLLADDEALWLYVVQMNMHAGLVWNFYLKAEGGESNAQVQGADNILNDELPVHHPVIGLQPSPALVPTPSFPSTIDGPVGYLSSGWPVAYLIATVIFGIGALISFFTYAPHPVQVADRFPVGTNDWTVPEPQMEFVGRITGMVDCQWADQSTAAINGAYVPLDRKYALSSGLMEITYDSGAKVILQGPVTYEVESPAGGYLSLGKLTAKLEKRSTVNGQKSTIRNLKSEISNPQSLIPNPFVIRTPTAVVTDLGTEFGVEVDKRGVTTSHVFRGLVRVQGLADDGKPEGDGQLLRENESARMERGGQGRIVVISTAKSAGFIREIPKLKMKTLDLVDVVAGGDGFSNRRGAGIDPTDGRVTDTAPKISSHIGDGQYHRVAGLPFVDGVFIPDGRTGQVQVDSAGHTFADFSSASNMTSHYIWAGGVIPIPADNLHMIILPTTLAGVDYASPGHGLLFMHANKGITFDLNAVRQANPGWKPVRFRAIAGDTETGSAQGISVFADIMVLVDGQVRFKRRDISGYSGVMPVVIPIGKNDRFLTLVATDSGNGIQFDWIIFGDPRLELISTIYEEKQP